MTSAVTVLVAGVSLGLDASRSYGTVAEMLRAEGERDDGIDAVAIMTPNDTHYQYAAAALDAGLDVICDKPVAHTHAQAVDLAHHRVVGGLRAFRIERGVEAPHADAQVAHQEPVLRVHLDAVGAGRAA